MTRNEEENKKATRENNDCSEKKRCVTRNKIKSIESVKIVVNNNN